MKNAGADDSILKALGSAKIVAAGTSDGKGDPAMLQHISDAGAWMQSERYTDAAQKLQAAGDDPCSHNEDKPGPRPFRGTLLLASVSGAGSVR